MRLLEITIRDINRPYWGRTERIVLDGLPDGLVGFEGANGAGKTTALGAACLALYGTLPSYEGSVFDRVGVSREAYVEAVFVDGATQWRATRRIDGVKRQQRCLLSMRAVGEEDWQAASDGSASDYTEQVERHFGSLDLYLSSVYQSQDRTGAFHRARKAQRKDLFAELLGLGELQELASRAKDERQTEEGELRARREDLARVQRDEAALVQARSELEVAQPAEASARGELEAVRLAEQRAVEAEATARAAALRLEGLEAAERSAGRELAATEAELVQLDTRPAKLEAELARRLDEIDRRGTAQLLTRARRDHEVRLAEIHARRQRYEETLQRQDEIEAAAGQVVAIEQRLAACDEIAVRERELRHERTAAKLAVQRAEAELGRLRKLHEERRAQLARQAELLQRVPCSESARRAGVDAMDAGLQLTEDLAGTCPLLADARRAADEHKSLTMPAEPFQAETFAAQDAEAALQAVAAEIERIVDEHGDPRAREAQIGALRRELAAARKTAALAATLEPARRELAALAADRACAQQRLEAAGRDAQAAHRRDEADRQAVREQHEHALEEVRNRRLRTAQAVAAARQRHAEAHAAAEQARRDAATGLDHARAALVRIRRERDDREAALQRLQESRVRLDQQVDALRAMVEAGKSHADCVGRLERDLEDWTLLEHALGRDGVQALEIDAAGPGVSEIANELLRAALGGRFALRLDTLRATVDGKREREVFDVVVFDAETSTDRPIEEHSGGELALLTTALSLAIATYHARKSRTRWETAWLDETSGALSEDAKELYPAMVRRAAELAGIRQVLIVSHDRAVLDQCDAAVQFERGAGVRIVEELAA